MVLITHPGDFTVARVENIPPGQQGSPLYLRVSAVNARLFLFRARPPRTGLRESCGMRFRQYFIPSHQSRCVLVLYVYIFLFANICSHPAVFRERTKETGPIDR